MKPTDITIDLETLALSSNAAILQIGAVAWDREAIDDPFLNTTVFDGHVDVRSCIMDGFDIEESTLAWWREKSDYVKVSLLTPPVHSLLDVLIALNQWLRDHGVGSDKITVWANGSDFDMAILRNAYARYKMKFPFKHTCIRDARTFIMEVGPYKMFPEKDPEEYAQLSPISIYQQFEPLPADANLKHNAVYDARLTTWQVWQLLKKL